MSDATQCTACEPGFYCPEGSYRMRDCPPGYFCELNTANYLDTPCGKGRFRAAPRGETFDDCAFCPPGHYCTKDIVEPIACPPGTFSELSGATAADTSQSGPENGWRTCEKCTAGHFCPLPATISPYECGLGYYSHEGAHECTLCQSGY